MAVERKNMTEEAHVALAATLGNAQYDIQSKTIWRYKELIAPILQMTVEEFKDMEISEIIACINEAEITNNKAVDDVSAKIEIETLDTEVSSISEKLIRYDTHLKTKNPRLSTGEILIMLHIDLEIQNEYKPSDPKYPITKRAIYYAARELSSQLGVLTETTNYNDLEKVYSIWICNTGIPKELHNSITRYSMKRENVVGIDNEPVEYHDLINVVIVRRGGEPENDTIFDYIDAVYSNDVDRVERYTDIGDNQNIRKELGDIMTASQTLIAQGIEQGIEQGRAEERQSNIKKVAENYLNLGLASTMNEALEKAKALLS